jgi:hypothetical protein
LLIVELPLKNGHNRVPTTKENTAPKIPMVFQNWWMKSENGLLTNMLRHLVTSFQTAGTFLHHVDFSLMPKQPWKGEEHKADTILAKASVLKNLTGQEAMEKSSA